ncbi:MAG: hypothetical protein MUF22_05980, partial [Chitinispirillaceae bacterium]|nr:hypothetical protein [Chitinispirillaceae bacterium]
MIEKCRIAAALVVLICSLSSAQSMLAAHYPAGLQLAVSTGPSLGIGGAGAGVKKDFFGIADNVANLGSVDRAVFSAVVSSDFL